MPARSSKPTPSKPTPRAPAAAQAIKRWQPGDPLHQEEINLLLTDAYYRVLGEQPEFVAGLKHLKADYAARLRDGTLDENPAALKALAAFARRWRLPLEHGLRDLEWSLRKAVQRPERWSLRLWPSYRGFLTGSVGRLRGTPVELEAPAGRSDTASDAPANAATAPRKAVLLEHKAHIPWPTGPDFFPDLNHQSDREIMAQMDAAWKVARKQGRAELARLRKEHRANGWRTLGPEHHRPEDRRRLAYRLYWWVVEGLNGTEIVDLEVKAAKRRPDPGARYDPPDDVAVRASVRSWAKAIGISLPKRPPGPRPATPPRS